MDRQFPQVHWAVRPVVILAVLLVIVDLILVAMTQLGLATPQDYTQRFAVKRQTSVLDTEAAGVRQLWRQFQDHMADRAHAAHY